MKLKKRCCAVFLVMTLLLSVLSVAPTVYAAAEISNVKATSINDGENIVLTWDEADFVGGEQVHIWRMPFAPEVSPARTTAGAVTTIPWTKLAGTVAAGTRTYTDTLGVAVGNTMMSGNSYRYYLNTTGTAPTNITTGDAPLLKTEPDVSNWAASKPVENTVGGKTVYNIARGKPVEARDYGSGGLSPFQSPRYLWRLVDGLDSNVINGSWIATNHNWKGGSTAGGSINVGDSGNYITLTLDLLKSERFDTIAVIPRMGEADGSKTTGWGPSGFDVYVSDNYADIYNNVNRVIAGKTQSIACSYTGANANIEDFNFSLGSVKTARYIGIRITSTYASDKSVQVMELKAFRKPLQLTYELEGISVNASTKNVSAKILYPDTATAATTAVFALYSTAGDELLGVEVKDNFVATNGSVTLTSFADYIESGEAGTIKCLIWNSVDGLKPLTAGKLNVLELPQTP